MKMIGEAGIQAIISKINDVENNHVLKVLATDKLGDTLFNFDTEDETIRAVLDLIFGKIKIIGIALELNDEGVGTLVESGPEDYLTMEYNLPTNGSGSTFELVDYTGGPIGVLWFLDGSMRKRPIPQDINEAISGGSGPMANSNWIDALNTMFRIVQ